MGKINTSIASNNLSNLSFYIDTEVSSADYTFPSTISTSVTSPIFAKIKNIRNSTINIYRIPIVFYYGQPLQGSPFVETTINPNETKYFSVISRYLPSTFVDWSTYTNIKIGGKTSIKKQNLGGGKINLRPRVYAFVATGTGLSPNINNLRFYNTGLTQNGQPIYYDETKVYWLTYISSAWIIALIGTVGASGLFVKFSSINPVGSYTGSTGYSGTVTIAAI